MQLKRVFKIKILETTAYFLFAIYIQKSSNNKCLTKINSQKKTKKKKIRTAKNELQGIAWNWKKPPEIL